jgi:hypothetical protein
MILTGKNRRTRKKKPTPVPFCPPETNMDGLTRDVQKRRRLFVFEVIVVRGSAEIKLCGYISSEFKTRVIIKPHFESFSIL